MIISVFVYLVTAHSIKLETLVYILNISHKNGQILFPTEEKFKIHVQTNCLVVFLNIMFLPT